MVKQPLPVLVSSLLAEGGLDPSFVIGGKFNSCGTNAQLG